MFLAKDYLSWGKLSFIIRASSFKLINFDFNNDSSIKKNERKSIKHSKFKTPSLSLDFDIINKNTPNNNNF